ncbi:acyl carrier protein [Amycolatopsis sp. NPDC059657]|uniref:acyl carrier protein n=1 Tax=Amycolatopsis sp. NPDC059657 TaxID=3346899 RepID=UPI003671DDE8
MLTLDELLLILTDCAGSPEPVSGELIDAEFADLGYDSVALIEATGRLSRDHGVELDDDATATARTPRALLELINHG